MKRIGPLNDQLIKTPYVHRIELLDRFFQILDAKEIVLVKPSCWSDPMENMIYNATIIKNGQPFEHPAKKSIYGQCWSYEGDSYALWQIYTTKPNDSGVVARHMGIRMTTNLKKLRQISELNKGSFHYGLVDYKWKKELSKLPKDKKFIKGLKLLELNHHHLKTLLVKRKSYSYENELRLLAIPNSKHVDKKKDILCRLKIEPLNFFSSLRLDPALKFSDFKKIKEKLVEKYGFEPRKITQSTLSKTNKLVFNLDKI